MTLNGVFHIPVVPAVVGGGFIGFSVDITAGDAENPRYQTSTDHSLS
jgi:hypothetical protein